METPQFRSGSGGEVPEAPVASKSTPLLRRSRTDRVIAGVCGGLGHYLNVDPVLVRIAWVALTLAAGTGLLIYLIAWIVVPEEREGEQVTSVSHDSGATARVVIGGTLIVIGAVLFIQRFVSWIDGRLLWSLALIAVGLLVIMRGVSR